MTSSVIKESPSPPADLDDLRLQAQGHKAELDRNFSFLSLLSFAFSIMMSYITYTSVLIAGLSTGGAPASFWAPWVACFANVIIALGLAELSSAYPSTGGPYHYAFMIASSKLRASAAFVTGWFNIAAYLFCLASGTNFMANNIFGLVMTYYPGSYQYHSWHPWMVYAAILVLGTALVLLLPRLIPTVQTLFLWASLSAMFAIGITILACSPTKAEARAVFVTWENPSGWTDGFAFMLAVGQSCWLFSAVDSATHIAEEISAPQRNVPRVMILSLFIGILATIFFSLAVLFSCPDVPAIAQSPVPMYAAFKQAVPDSVALFFSIWIFLVTFGGVIALSITCGRLVWAFARDNGLPCSNYLAHVHSGLKIPVRATIISTAIAIALGTIGIGSKTAFNTFISSAIACFNISYSIPQLAALVSSARARLPRDRYLNLGPTWGPICNVFTVAWTLVYLVIFSFPLVIPVTRDTMSYTSVIVVGWVVLVAGCWFLPGGKRAVFTGPDVEHDLEVLDAYTVELVGRYGDGDDVVKAP